MSGDPIPGIERILFTEEQIDARIREVAAEISRRYAGRSLTLIGVLKGSVFFLTALARHIEVPVKIDFLAISSFSNKSGSPGVVRIAKDLDESIEGEDVLLVEDIVDTGFTLRYLLQTLAGRAPNSLSVCTFLDRNSRRIVQVPVDFRCFEIPDRFVVGFGLDSNQLYRNLGYVAVMKHENLVGWGGGSAGGVGGGGGAGGGGAGPGLTWPRGLMVFGVFSPVFAFSPGFPPPSFPPPPRNPPPPGPPGFGSPFPEKLKLTPHPPKRGGVRPPPPLPVQKGFSETRHPKIWYFPFPRPGGSRRAPSVG